MTAGRRRDKIVFQRYTVSEDEAGEAILTEDLPEICQEMAAVFYGSGQERREAALEQGRQTASFEVLSNTATRSVSVRDRISFGTGLWDITEIAPDTPRLGEIRFTAVRAL